MLRLPCSFARSLLALALALGLSSWQVPMPQGPPANWRAAEHLGPAVAALLSPHWPKVYLITYEPGVEVDSATDALRDMHGLGELYRYHHALRGAALFLPDPGLVSRIAADPRVESITPDRLFRGTGKPQPPQSVPAGLIRVGGLETDNEGAGVVVAVIDSGIDLDHPDLVANIHPTLKADFVGDHTTQMNPGDDPHGHGTHVSGILAATANSIGSLGVASQVTLVPVRVLNRQNFTTETSLFAGIDYVTQHADVIKVANVSIAGPADPPGQVDPLHVAIQNSVAAGVTYVVCAANEADDAANWVPASYDEVITVSAYYLGAPGGDRFAQFSNFGPDVDIAAPGVYVYSTWRNGGYGLLSGTSMATPHVAAAAAMYLGSHPHASPAMVRSKLLQEGENGYPDQGALHPEPLLNVRGL